MDIPLSFPSVIVFIFTLGVGYLVLIWAYWIADRLNEWYALDAFDKTLQTLVIGGTVTFVSLVILGAPLSYLISGTPSSDTFWWNWFWTNLGAIIIVESVMFLAVGFLLQSLLSREETVIDYST